MAATTLTVSDVACDGCVKTIKTALANAKGVQDVHIVHDKLRKEGVVRVHGTAGARALISALKTKGKTAMVVSKPPATGVTTKVLAATSITVWATVAAVSLLEPAAREHLASLPLRLPGLESLTRILTRLTSRLPSFACLTTSLATSLKSSLGSSLASIPKLERLSLPSFETLASGLPSLKSATARLPSYAGLISKLPSMEPLVEKTQLVASRIVPTASQFGLLLKGALNNFVNRMPALSQLPGQTQISGKN